MSDPAMGYNHVGTPLPSLLWVIIMYVGLPMSDPAVGYNHVCWTTLCLTRLWVIIMYVGLPMSDPAVGYNHVFHNTHT